MDAVFLTVLVTLVIAATGIHAAFARALSNARSRLAARSKTMETSFGTLEYAVIGDGEPVLIIHGAGGGFDQAIDIGGSLAGRGYRLIAPSRFGYLGSTLPGNLTTAMQADAYRDLFDHLGVGKAFVIAISAGAWSALQFAIRHPERCRALALLVPADHLPRQIRNRGGAFVWAVCRSDFIAWAGLKLMPGVMTRIMLATDPALVCAAGPSEKARVQQVLDHFLPVSARSGGMQSDIRTGATPGPDPIERIACPVLAISAEDDAFGTASRAKYIASSVLNGRAVIYPTGGHALVARYGDTLGEITSFLGSARPADPPAERSGGKM